LVFAFDFIPPLSGGEARWGVGLAALSAQGNHFSYQPSPLRGEGVNPVFLPTKNQTSKKRKPTIIS
jgi:hypothetical protein